MREILTACIDDAGRGIACYCPFLAGCLLFERIRKSQQFRQLVANANGQLL